VVRMNAEPLDPGKSYLLKHTSQTVKARVRTIHRVNMQTLEPEPAATLELNSIGVVEVETTRPLFLDTYEAQRVTGSFILIDAASHATVAAGMVREILSGQSARDAGKGRPVAAIAIPNLELLRLLETALLEAGVDVVRTRAGNQELLQRLFQARVVVLLEAAAGEVSIALPGKDETLSFEPIAGLPEEPSKAIAHLLRLLADGSKE
jgi:sulfate adenylyltransferase subunit 1 (EFTu-like GTPase family)